MTEILPGPLIAFYQHTNIFTPHKDLGFQYKMISHVSGTIIPIHNLDPQPRSTRQHSTTLINSYSSQSTHHTVLYADTAGPTAMDCFVSGYPSVSYPHQVGIEISVPFRKLSAISSVERLARCRVDSAPNDPNYCCQISDVKRYCRVIFCDAPPNKFGHSKLSQCNERVQSLSIVLVLGCFLGRQIALLVLPGCIRFINPFRSGRKNDSISVFQSEVSYEMGLRRGIIGMAKARDKAWFICIDPILLTSFWTALVFPHHHIHDQI